MSYPNFKETDLRILSTKCVEESWLCLRQPRKCVQGETKAVNKSSRGQVEGLNSNEDPRESLEERSVPEA